MAKCIAINPTPPPPPPTEYQLTISAGEAKLLRELTGHHLGGKAFDLFESIHYALQGAGVPITERDDLQLKGTVTDA